MPHPNKCTWRPYGRLCFQYMRIFPFVIGLQITTKYITPMATKGYVSVRLGSSGGRTGRVNRQCPEAHKP